MNKERALSTLKILSKLSGDELDSTLAEGDMSIQSIISKTTTAQTYTYSLDGVLLYFLKCVVNWSYDNSTKKITALTPVTTYGADGLINYNSGLIKNVQDIKSVSGMDVGRVQKCVGIYNAATPGYQGFSWWLVADVNVTGGGLVAYKKQDVMSYLTYKSYTWS